MKPIIAFSFSGVVVKNTPWKEAHKVWFESFAKKLNRPEIVEYANKENWFDYVDDVMKIAEPEKSDDERTIDARKTYFDIVCDLGCDARHTENKEVIEYLLTLKEKFSLGIITTNPLETIERILKAFKQNNLFDFIECSLLNEKDDKLLVFKRFIKNYGKPVLFVGGSRHDSYAFCDEQKIKCAFANFDSLENLSNILTLH